MPEEMRIALCEFCGWKRVFPAGDPSVRVSANDTMSSKKTKCPKCGRSVTPRKFPNPQGEADTAAKEQRNKLENEAWLERSAEYQREFIRARDGKDID